MPRVVFIGHSAQPSGAELGLLRLSRAMARYEPVVILAEQGPLVEQLRLSGVECLVFPVDTSVATMRHHQIKLNAHAVGTAFRANRYARELGRLVHVQSPDLIDTFTLKAHVFGRLAARALRVSKVAHVHDRLALQYMRPTSIALLRPILGRSDGLVFNSASTQATVPSLRRGQIRAVLGSAIDQPVSVKRSAGHQDAFTFGCVGRLTPWKGQKIALLAFAELCARYPGRRLRLKFIGGALFGEESYVAELKALTRALALDQRTEWIGHVADVYAALDDVDALVHCSAIPEPFGQVVVEGMAYGVPVIVSDEGGPSEYVKDGVSGLTFAPRSVPSLTHAMVRAMTLSREQENLLTAAGRMVAASFTADITAARTEAFYDEVLRLRR